MEPWSPAVLAILDKYARKTESGKVIHCRPREDEPEDRAGRKPSQNKLIFDTEQIAQKAALEIRNLANVVLYSYPCHRSTQGHRHLTHLKPKGKSGQLRGSTAARRKRR